MKKLLKYSVTDGLQSLMPILLWVLLPLFYKDSLWADGFIVTYPYQFVGMIFYDILFLSQVKYEEAEHMNIRHHSRTGIFVYGVFWILSYGISVLNWGFIRNVFGLTETYRDIFQFGLASLGTSYMLLAVITLWQYEGKNRQGMILCFFWWILEICACAVISVFNTNLMYVMLLMFLVLIFILTYELNGMCFRFHLFGVKYTVTNLSEQIGMAVVYIFGLNKMGTSDICFLSAYNMMSMCTDVEWDVINSATDKYVTIEAASGKWNEKKMLSQGFIFGTVLSFVSICSVSVCSQIPVYRETINFKMVWILIIMEGSWFFASGMGNVMEHYLSFIHPNPVQPICTGISLALRTVVTILISSVWSVSIAMMTAEAFYMLYTILLYLWFRRRDVVVSKAL